MFLTFLFLNFFIAVKATTDKQSPHENCCLRTGHYLWNVPGQEILTPGHEIFRYHFSVWVLKLIRSDGTGHKNPQVCLLNIYL